MCTDGLGEEAASWFGTRQTALQVVSRLVLRLGGGKIVLQEGLDVLKSGPLVRVFLPAQAHHLMQRLRTSLRTWHPVSSLNLLQYLPVHHAYKKTGTERIIKCVDICGQYTQYTPIQFT